MKKHILLTRSRHDLPNQYLYAYSTTLLTTAENNGWIPSKAEDEKNNQKEVQSRLKNGLNFVVFNGHGDDDAIYGHKDECLIDLKSAKLLKGSIVFARACSAAKTLGPEACEKGCSAFIGYDGLLVIPHVNEYEATPLKDPSANPVLEVSNIVPTQIIAGSTVEAAVKGSKKKAAEILRQMLNSEEPYDKPAFKALFDNNLNLTFAGDPTASVR